LLERRAMRDILRKLRSIERRCGHGKTGNGGNHPDGDRG
jgi:hypothetical protein